MKMQKSKCKVRSRICFTLRVLALVAESSIDNVMVLSLSQVKSATQDLWSLVFDGLCKGCRENQLTGSHLIESLANEQTS